MKKYTALLFSLLVLSLASTATAAGLSVFVSILPEKYFVEQIGGSHIAINVLVGPGQSPATYEPTPRQMAEMTRTKIYFPIGVPFEKVWLQRIVANNPQLTIVDLSEGLKSRQFATTEHDHSAADHGHDHGEHDPHIWTDPMLVKIMAQRICQTLTDQDPVHAEDYAKNLATFQKALDALDTEIRAELAPVKNRRFLVFHPAWGYFAERYGLEEIAVEADGKEPGPQGLTKLIDEARQQQIHVIFVQKQFSTRLPTMIAKEINAQVAVLDPLAENWAANLRLAAQTFRNALEKP